MESKEFKRNIEYFIGKPFMTILGAVVSLVGLVFTMLALSTQRNNIIKAMKSPFTLISIAVLVAGIIVLVIASGKKSKVADIDQDIMLRTRDLEQKSLIKMNPATETKSKTPPPELLKAYPPLVLKGEDFTGTEKRYAKMKADGKYRSSMYAAASVIFTTDKLFILKRRFSIVEDIDTTDYNGKEKVSAFEYGTYYKDITYAALEDDVCTCETAKGNVDVNFKKLVIKAGDEVILELSVNHDSDVDKCIENTLALAERRRATAQS